MSRRKSSEKKSTVRVLAVEDNLGDLVLVREYLKAAALGEYEVNVAGTLGRAMGALEKSEQDVILLDLNLPDSQGFETFTKLYARFPKVPIVIITGLKDEDTATRAINEGAQDFLFKDDMTSSSLGHAIVYAIERKKIELEQMRA